MKPSYPTDERWPTSQIFGVNRASYARYGLLGHNGIDIALPAGNPVYAVLDGVVTLAETRKYGYGRHVRIQHNRFLSIYGHLSGFAYGEIGMQGLEVKAGEIIGWSGGAKSDPYSGNSTGAHLHFEIRPDGVSRSNGYAGAVDPFAYLLDRYYPAPRYTGTIKAQIGLNVRSKPSVLGRILRKARFGERVEAWDVVDGWARLYALRAEYASAQWLALDDVVVADNAPTTPEPDTIPVDVYIKDARRQALEDAIAALKNLIEAV